MSYQVLARKWRPRAFDDIVGQQHVVRALSNALDRDQLHHAYLFTGTRGVGKTTLARILSKALNCEQGVSSRPCGVCSACQEIDGGRFVDLLEVDAASRTKVDQTRELLDNVPYAPARARFKVYLIDEVHMFSSHSFNALLKTLEEPPPHVKFLLATTDPQKIPVTVLSRCLQFNLRRLLPGEIRDRLEVVLKAEGVDFDAGGLPLLARAADGSMRDALSLLDQAIAFSGGRVAEDEVRAMLGTVSGDLALNILDALAASDGGRILEEVERVAALTPDFPELLRELIALMHRLALIQQVPAILASDDPDHGRLAALAAAMQPEDLQLYYQVALTGQADLPLAPDPRAGFEMVLLRALAFRPAAVPPGKATAAVSPGAAAGSPGPSGQVASMAERRSAGGGVQRPAPGGSVTPVRPLESAAPHAPEAKAPVPAARMAPSPAMLDAAGWQQLMARLPLGGIASQLAHNCGFLELAGGKLMLTLDPAAQHLRVPSAESRLESALAEALGVAVKLEIQVARPREETLAQRRAREAGERQDAAVQALESDPVAQALRDDFEAEWVPGSMRPAD
ncbi:DNA polymerase III subunit gamma/tau [Thiorhodococcus mannitoliphagus]|uniref:DNA polymerase III subunit gamma/tau n=1 Tax=Thiorhodococcus mannitoliphagus TaxID=329406 RepID=A0A6P1DLD3_9GAMM|nr:DNA polymerase III subunit gamma/tau [Thiorhodococcus mannitoliphagus]NEX19047.1 DNA polymerase III subunit gamma/tau [Thiorhodococcus mannitoliphagus]